MSCSAGSAAEGICNSGGGGSRVHDVLLRVALRTVKAVRPSLVSSDPSATESELAFLFLLFFASTAVLSVLAIHHMAKDWDLWHQLALQFEVLTTSVPSIEGAVVASPGDLADDVGDEKKNVVNDKSLVDPANPTQLRCHDPSTSAFLGTVPNMSSSDVDALCLRAKLAHRNSWSKTTFAQRRLVLRTLQKYIVAHAEDICRASARDSGKTKVDALLGEVLTTCEKIRTVLAHGEEWLRPSYRPSGPMMLHKTAWVEYVPLGVLGIIAPWNYPFHNMLNHVISGLFSGNAVVTKCSEHTSYSTATYFHSICRAALVANGHDPDVLQVCTGTAEAGKALVECPHVDKVFFTGSPDVGRRVMAGAAPFLRPVVLELGGKDAMVFCDDVKMGDVVPWALRGCFQNCGQNCCGVERLFVYESRVEEFLKEIMPRVRDLRQGCPLASEALGTDGDVDCGAMVMDQQCDLIQVLIDDAVSKGATLHCGGKRNDDPALPKHGQFYKPTLISGVTKGMKIWSEETFGPVMCVVTVPNDDDDVCVDLVNDCPFGLGSSVYSASTSRAMSIGKRFRTGMFTANDFGVNYLIQSLPFGGVNDSGFGRFAGPEGLQACCLERSMVVDRIPGVRTSIPSAIGYPMSKRKGFPFGNALVGLFYNESLLGKARAIVDLIRYG